MESRTAKIIMVCKGQHNFGDDLNHKEAIAAYLSDECLCPIEYYTEDFINNTIFQAALDYLDSVQRPSAFIRSVYSVYDLYNNSLKKSTNSTSNFDWYKAICSAFETEQVKNKDGEYINGFTEENSQFVHRQNQTNKHHEEVDQYYIIAENNEEYVDVDDDEEEYYYYYDYEEENDNKVSEEVVVAKIAIPTETENSPDLPDKMFRPTDEMIHIPKDKAKQPHPKITKKRKKRRK